MSQDANGWLGLSYNCKWCKDKGCAVCPPVKSEAEEPPALLLTIPFKDDSQFREAIAKLKGALGASALEERAKRLGTGTAFHEETVRKILESQGAESDGREA